MHSPCSESKNLIFFKINLKNTLGASDKLTGFCILCQCQQFTNCCSQELPRQKTTITSLTAHVPNRLEAQARGSLTLQSAKASALSGHCSAQILCCSGQRSLQPPVGAGHFRTEPANLFGQENRSPEKEYKGGCSDLWSALVDFQKWIYWVAAIAGCGSAQVQLKQKLRGGKHQFLSYTLRIYPPKLVHNLQFLLAFHP